VYQEFVDVLPKDGVLIRSSDDYGCQQLKWKGETRVFGKESEKMAVGVPGAFNVRNAVAAGMAAALVGVPKPVIERVAAEFRGIWRRFEKVGERDGAVIYSDYGHHPTAIRETMKMVRELYPKRRVILVFQPHQHNRTKNLFTEFVDALSRAPVDVLVLNEIYDVAGREEDKDHDVTSKKLADAVLRLVRPGGLAQDGRKVAYTATLDETESWLRANMKKDDVVVIMGAGDIDIVARKLV
ncbi:MAG: cyanophycin synthetase, partial [Patescibacteria group bacterium]